MDSQGLIDVQFNRAVEIIQGLPKTGPVQTDYEEKLRMYSLYKQATVGNVKSPRPAVWDMLGRAKWDEWAKHKDLDPSEAKWLYVEALLKVLRRYSDKTIAKTYVEELESFNGDAGNIVMSRSFSRSSGSSSGGSTASDEPYPIPPELSQHAANQDPHAYHHPEAVPAESEEETTDDEVQEMQPQPSRIIRPQSSVSSHRYRTPLAGTRAFSPHTIPSTQPMPGFDTPSAFPERNTPSSQPPHHPFGQDPRAHPLSPPGGQPIIPPHRAYCAFGPGPAQRTSLDLAVENIQTYLASFTERLDMLEASIIHTVPSPGSSFLRRTSGLGLSPPGGRRSPADEAGGVHWDTSNMGLWSFVLRPTERCVRAVREAAIFVLADRDRSPTAVVVRRLVLDTSFLFCLVALLRMVWRSTGIRRREVYVALVVLGRALFGRRTVHRVNRALGDRRD